MWSNGTRCRLKAGAKNESQESWVKGTEHACVWAFSQRLLLVCRPFIGGQEAATIDDSVRFELILSVFHFPVSHLNIHTCFLASSSSSPCWSITCIFSHSHLSQHILWFIHITAHAPKNKQLSHNLGPISLKESDWQGNKSNQGVKFGEKWGFSYSGSTIRL